MLFITHPAPWGAVVITVPEPVTPLPGDVDFSFLDWHFCQSVQQAILLNSGQLMFDVPVATADIIFQKDHARKRDTYPGKLLDHQRVHQQALRWACQHTLWREFQQASYHVWRQFQRTRPPTDAKGNAFVYRAGSLWQFPPVTVVWVHQQFAQRCTEETAVLWWAGSLHRSLPRRRSLPGDAWPIWAKHAVWRGEKDSRSSMQVVQLFTLERLASPPTVVVSSAKWCVPTHLQHDRTSPTTVLLPSLCARGLTSWLLVSSTDGVPSLLNRFLFRLSSQRCSNWRHKEQQRRSTESFKFLLRISFAHHRLQEAWLEECKAVHLHRRLLWRPTSTSIVLTTHVIISTFRKPHPTNGPQKKHDGIR